MFMTRSEYDRSVNSFSPEGRLFQVKFYRVNSEDFLNFPQLSLDPRNLSYFSNTFINAYLQVEYAIEAIKLGSTAIGIQTKEGMNRYLSRGFKLGCVVRMAVDSILLDAESGPNDHRKDAALFIITFQDASLLLKNV